MILEPFVFDCGPLEVNLYIMADEASGKGILVDAGVHDESVLQFVEQNKLDISTILITHLHDDHIGGLSDYAKAWGSKIFAPAAIPNVQPVSIVAAGSALDAGPFKFDIFQTSGHTPESISYYCAEQGVCFVGDAIFAGAVGGTSCDDLHGEEIGCLATHIMTLPPTTELYSGHGPVTTVAIESAANPFLQPGFTRRP